MCGPRWHNSDRQTEIAANLMIQRLFVRHSDVFGTQRFAIIMASTALIRVIVWLLLIFGYIFRVDFVVSWFDSVAFVSVLSAMALLLTDWAQFAASAVGLSVVERAQAAEEMRTDVAADIDRLVEMAEAREPAGDARVVADRIRQNVRPK
jgi:hypothetical protein